MSFPLRLISALLILCTFIGAPLYFQIFHTYDPGTMILSFTISFLVGSILLVMLFIRERDSLGRTRFFFNDKAYHSWQNIPLDSENLGIISVKDPDNLFRSVAVSDIAKRVLPVYLLLLIPTIYLLLQVFNHNILYTQSERSTEMSGAYDAAAGLVEARMKKFAPQDLEVLKKTERHQLIVVMGDYDKVEGIIARSNIRHTLVRPEEIPDDLSRAQVILVNCPGNIPEWKFDAIRKFVSDGGSLITTDWALGNLIAKAFPDMISPNGLTTRNECIDIEKSGPPCRVTDFMMPQGSHPHWWLFGSYPVTVNNPEKVNVFLKSEEFKAKYNDSPVSAAFRWGEGVVVHIATHFFQHRSELRTDRHKQPAMTYVTECLGLTREELPEKILEGLENQKVAPVENAYSTHQFIISLITEARKMKLAGELVP
ncbi:MAG: hypothetical protein CVV64_04505 [Candidatus Wallbacteria bacterium HGW-Wallbacteria-1]|uniref:DUF4350 domain-containing protein n=1 Tax=Candidatus Wallbacteria bacterium HGW-Wallbacteria-1 TaxID=2013854 RepID=A0A2N1PRS1_9BACT|nr:MAG: hypothetical protein CVV64_04505 [Candidatus Wallbacteria bacterium HGW-Wallbacteria-1]